MAAGRRTSFASDDPTRRFLRAGMFWSALFGTLAFFIDWGAYPIKTTFGSVPQQLTGIVGVEQLKWTWWNTPSPQLLFILLLASLCLCALGYRSSGSAIDVVVVVLGLALLVLQADILWALRHVFSYVTGFWIVVGASVLMTGFAIASTLHKERT